MRSRFYCTEVSVPRLQRERALMRNTKARLAVRFFILELNFEIVFPGIARSAADAGGTDDRSVNDGNGRPSDGPAQDAVNIKVHCRSIGSAFDDKLVPADRTAWRTGTVQVEPARAGASVDTALVLRAVISFSWQCHRVVFA